MRVLHLNTHDVGGSWVYARTLSDALRDAGHESMVLHRDITARPFSDKLLRRSTLALARGAWHGTHRTLPPPPHENIESADVVHLHTVADWFDVPAWVRRLPRRVRLVVNLHDLWHASGGCFVYGNCERFRVDCRHCPLLRFPASRLLASHEQRRKADAYQEAGARFIVNSHWLRDLVKDSTILRGSGIAMIPPPVDPEIFHPQDRSACRARFRLRDDDLVVATGCASLTDTNKDTRGLLEMLVKSGHPHIKVLMFGAGNIPIPDGLDVRNLGPIPDKSDLAAIYGAADLFASASRMETYGLTLAEAYACGCAVVAHDTGGIAEALPHDPSVTLVPPGDRTAFVDAISHQLRQCLERSPSSGTSRSPARASTPGQAVERLVEVYERDPMK